MNQKQAKNYDKIKIIFIIKIVTVYTNIDDDDDNNSDIFVATIRVKKNDWKAQLRQEKK